MSERQLDWQKDAACTSVNPELFFPETTRGGERQIQITEAKKVCGSCAVQAACLSYALETGQSFGIWGGTTEDERRTMKRKPKGSQPENGSL